MKIGVRFLACYPPERLPTFAREVEELGFNQLWLVEDCFATGGVATAATALAATGHIEIGIGIFPAVLRNVVLLSMEIATLARLYSGRVLPGIGHGVNAWMKQVGAAPKSAMRALEESFTALRLLLHGEKVTVQGSHVNVDGGRLAFPPDRQLPLYTAGRGPKTLALAGRLADGVILGDFSSPAYTNWARCMVLDSAKLNDRCPESEITVYAYFDFDERRLFARRATAERLLAGAPIRAADTELQARLTIVAQSLSTANALGPTIPGSFINSVTVSGNAASCSDAIAALANAGAESVVLVPHPEIDVALEHLRRAAVQIVPELQRL